MRVLAAAGERVAVDGTVETGTGDVDAALITGESVAAAVGPGDKVFAGTVSLSAPLTIRVTAVGEETLLAEILRRATGEELEPLGRKNFFDPLGMANTHFGYEEPWKERVIPIFDSGLGLHEWHTPELLGAVRGDTGAYSTALDIAALCQTMLDHGSYGETRILSPVTVQRMVEHQYPWWDTPERLSAPTHEQFVHLSKGLGWMPRGPSFYRGADLMSPRAFFHGGHMGMRAIVDPDYDLITVFMTSIVATDPDVSAYFGAPGQVHHTFGTMAFAAVAEL